MPTPKRREGARPDAADLAALDQPPPRLRKASEEDPVVVAGTPRRPPANVSAKKTKLGFYVHPEAANRARAAYPWTEAVEGHGSFSDFVAAALMEKVERLEAKHNAGKPWPAVEAGQLPAGRPLSS